MSPNVQPLFRIDRVPGTLSSRDLWPFEAYAEARRALVAELITLKRSRRVALGEHCSIVFESRATVWFQIHEELHLHPGDRDRRALELLDEYQDLVPRPGELAASLFLECSGVADVRALSLHLAQHLRALTLHLPRGTFRAEPLESLPQGIPGVAFLRFVREPDEPLVRAPTLRWQAPLYPVIAQLSPAVEQALSGQPSLS